MRLSAVYHLFQRHYQIEIFRYLVSAGTLVEFQVSTHGLLSWVDDFFSKCDQSQSPADLLTFTKEIFDEKLHFLCSDVSSFGSDFSYIIQQLEMLRAH